MANTVRRWRIVFHVWVEKLHEGTQAYDHHLGNVDPTLALV